MFRTSIVIVLMLSVFHLSVALPSKRLSLAKVGSRQLFCPDVCDDKEVTDFVCADYPGCSVQPCLDSYDVPGFKCGNPTSNGNTPSPVPTPRASSGASPVPSPGVSTVPSPRASTVPSPSPVPSANGSMKPSPVSSPSVGCTYTSQLNGFMLKNAKCTCPSGSSTTEVEGIFSDPSAQAKAVAYVKCIDKYLKENCGSIPFDEAAFMAKRICCDNEGKFNQLGVCPFFF